MFGSISYRDMFVLETRDAMIIFSTPAVTCQHLRIQRKKRMSGSLTFSFQKETDAALSSHCHSCPAKPRNLLPQKPLFLLQSPPRISGQMLPPPESSTHFPTQTIHLHQVFFVTRLFLPLHVYGSQISALIKYRIDLHPDLHFFTVVFSSAYFRTTLITHQIIFIKSLHLVFLLLPLASLITHPSSNLTHYTPHITHITHITPRTTQYPASPWFAWLALQTSLSSPFLQA